MVDHDTYRCSACDAGETYGHTCPNRGPNQTAPRPPVDLTGTDETDSPGQWGHDYDGPMTLTYSFTCTVPDSKVAASIHDMLTIILPFMADSVEVHDANEPRD